jgi:hypothetical protein
MPPATFPDPGPDDAEPDGRPPGGDAPGPEQGLYITLPAEQLTLVRARNATCTAPGCGRPAARCDLDHTRPWDQGGRGCECNMAPPCKR